MELVFFNFLSNSKLGLVDIYRHLDIIMMLLLEKFGKNLVHGSRENSNMVVDGDGSFIENSEAF
jgi:hypothetical protein